MQGAHIRRGDCPPAYRIQEGILNFGAVKASRLGQSQLFLDARARFHLPDHLQGFPDPIIIDGVQRDQVMSFLFAQGQRRRRKGAFLHLDDHITPLPHSDDLALLWNMDRL